MHSLQSWLGKEPLAGFVAQYFHKLPYSRQADRSLCQLCQWDTIGRILEQPSADVMVCRRNERYDGPAPQSMEAAQTLAEQGYTILVRHAERWDTGLAELAAGFSREFAGEVNVHLYATPPAEFGFGWHYDVEDVFILQTQGEKEYSLRKNTVNPWPVQDAIPQDMKYEREIMPLMRCLLKSGDWLYIPAGYWHMGQAAESAISIAVGVLSPTALDTYDLLRRELLASLLWRQRLPAAREATGVSDEQLRESLAELLEQLGSDLHKLITSKRFMDQLVEQLRGK
jgi:ribosomal protein L16 Arg81 hydroxylase